MKGKAKTKQQLLPEMEELRTRLDAAERRLQETNERLHTQIAKRKRAEETFERVQKYAESIVETIREPLIVLTPDLKVISANRSFYETFQVTPKVTRGKYIFDIGNHQWDIPALRELLEEIIPENAHFNNFEVDHEFPVIGRRTMLLNARRIYREGKGTEMILLALEDITERKRADEEIRRLNEQVGRKALDLELANKELDSFTSAVSHDLKNELIVISAFTGKLIKRHMERLDAKGQDYMRIINSSVENLTTLVGDLLELSRLSKAKMKVEMLNLSELVLPILKKYQGKDPERKVEVVVPQKVEAWGDRRLLTVMLDNLLSNSWKFTKNAVPARIEFGETQESEEPIFFIRDNGCGFTVPADLEQIFLPFTRFHNVEDYPGTGVGLATVKRIISRHGGKIWVESSVGKGTVFYFTLQKIME
jgi:two-component system CheB/CheR fusion protein